jgi:hypothetical protein
MPPNPVGITFVTWIFMSSDLKSYVYSIDRRLDVHYLVDGLRKCTQNRIPRDAMTTDTCAPNR